ncbi:hypothetical protein FA15DRAFT_675059 [Coprinopsis marcescibilis]|uniref:Nephrocystin 3-like N-terminal domain-containing protein n=1 Tax=Coprinopsis marcescibilis TaxID=230819 RepID=A0A5C3KGG2_COPMA|nr:hypothetical protein FA15DRAFT_675059 [Coprinopsis marcescibilis]
MSILSNAFNTSLENSNLTVVTGIQGNVHINQVSQVSDGMKMLFQHVAPEAIHDASARFDAPRCSEGTREAVQDDIMNWAIPLLKVALDPRFLLWISGAAGTGKSAIQQTISENTDKNRTLLATFFFSHQSLERDNPDKLIPTLAYQIAVKISAVRAHIVAAVINDVSIFTKSPEKQMKALIVDPVLRVIEKDPSAPERWPKLIIIDGLDECKRGGARTQTSFNGGDSAGECQQLVILKTILAAFRSYRLPFRVAIASRPDLPMRDFFSPSGPAGPFTRHIVLNEHYNPDADIRLYLRSAFEVLRLKHSIPLPWPSEKDIETIVESASGQFIYAATVVRFVGDASCRPRENLQLILSVKVVDKKNPFAPLDAMYTTIFRACPDPLGSILALKLTLQIAYNTRFDRYAGNREFSSSDINSLLQLDSCGVARIFGRLYSLVSVPTVQLEDNTEHKPYTVYHRSLAEFLDEPSRCGELFVPSEAILEKICIQFIRTTSAPFNIHHDENCARGCRSNFHGGVMSERIVLVQRKTAVWSGASYLTIDNPICEELVNRAYEPTHLRTELDQCNVDAWVIETISRGNHRQLEYAYFWVHSSNFGCKPWFECSSTCKRWRKAINLQCRRAGWNVPIFRHITSLFISPVHPGQFQSLPINSDLVHFKRNEDRRHWMKRFKPARSYW